jgi:drug/metabolite transporter (DMT)-like permease
MRTALCLVLIVLGTTSGEVSVSRAMKNVGGVRSFSIKCLPSFLRCALRQPWFWFGIGFLALNFFTLLTLLSWEDVSFAIPATALSYVTGGLAARLLLREHLTRLRWIGILLVASGVTLATLGG